MSKIGILGGSFNPIHEGHLYIARKAKEQLGLDKVLIVPTLVSPFKVGQAQLSFEERYTMCKLACKGYDYLEVSSIERELSSPSYTINTVEALRKQSDAAFYLIMGSDQAAQLDKWKENERLASLVTFAVIARQNEAITCPYEYKRVECEVHPASSTLVRKGYFQFLNKDVRNYIFEHELYLKDIVHSYMSDRRFAHSLSVRKLSVELAKIHQLDEHKASLAALLHDIAKEFDEDMTNYFMKFETREHQSDPKPILHQYVGAAFVKQVMCLEDQDVLSAIYHHTTGGVDNPYVYLLFIADKIEPTRKYDVTQELQLAHIDLKTCYQYVARKQKEYLKKGN